MQSIFRSPSKRRPLLHHRGFVDGAGFKYVRDRGLDHVVEREKHLRPVINVKNLIKSEPSKSIPISVISQQRDSLRFPFRPIDFIRKYPAIFEEFLPGGIHPHIKLKTEVLDLDAEENLVYQSDNYRQNVADRLLKLLMISRINKIPLRILDTLKWHLGLPQDYVQSLVPEFPDYFRVIDGSHSTTCGLKSDLNLELVCWNSELAVSAIEKKVKGYEKGMPIVFPMHFSRGSEMDKKVKKWVDDWQRLPYISPYENACHLGPNTDESDRWAVAVMHEVLNLFVAKFGEWDNVLQLGEWLGIRSRLKRALLHHPGVFYLSSKVGTYTVVLREGFKRGLLIEKNPLVDIRNQYLHLMHSVKEDSKLVSMPGGSKQEKKTTTHEESKAEEKMDDNDLDDSLEESDDESLEESDDDRDHEFQADGNEDSEEDENGEQYLKKRGAFRNDSSSRGRTNRKIMGVQGSSRGFEISSDSKGDGKPKEKNSRRREMSRELIIHGISKDGRKFNDDEFEDNDSDNGEEGKNGEQYLKQRGAFRNASSSRGRTNRNDSGVLGSSRGFEIQRSDSKGYSKPKDKISRRRDTHRDHNIRGSSKERCKFSGDKFGDDANDYQEKENGEQYLRQGGAFRNASSSRGRTNRKGNMGFQGASRGFERQRSDSKGHGKPKENFSKRRETSREHNIRGSSGERSSSTDSRGRSLPIKNIST
ncbi:hypothetical protein HS088_TW04G01289 [Tripterygium wilfordii]|uniref:PORR domain-containing protein n=1 Tax=Tripterygium wilfordii TaxID=458696 RepID=A0A7J7DSN7_TRIWF|nr:protein WHAT'S THIS FACTOR 9, mitochondrial-like [Tripterygium wilfordii]XP_038700797.1 protein WHAT'S THIS FACTOR 9, mitochondrial-like [Tripterygium wilfordii]KAF5749321.1 hypothetical protein HS088_TW04G01289 [Tripterygium wilfordii]